MLYSQETTYALRIMTALKDEKIHQATEICLSQTIPQPWAYKIAKKLEDAGFIAIQRGRYGGYKLAKSLDDISFKELILSIEPDFCVRPCINCPCEFHIDKGSCPVFKELLSLQTEIFHLLDKRSLRHVICENQ